MANNDEFDLLEEAEFEIIEDEREKVRKNQLLGDFGKNFHGYVRYGKKIIKNMQACEFF